MTEYIPHRLRESNENLAAEVDRQREEIKRLRSDRRERIATAMMAALIAKPDIRWSADALAQSAIYHADQLIWQLDKEPQP